MSDTCRQLERMRAPALTGLVTVKTLDEGWDREETINFSPVFGNTSLQIRWKVHKFDICKSQLKDRSAV